MSAEAEAISRKKTARVLAAGLAVAGYVLWTSFAETTQVCIGSAIDCTVSEQTAVSTLGMYMVLAAGLLAVASLFMTGSAAREERRAARAMVVAERPAAIERVLERDGHACRDCATTQGVAVYYAGSPALGGDAVSTAAQYLDEGNMVTLCPQHKRMRNEKVETFPVVF